MKFVLQLVAALTLAALSACAVILSVDAHQFVFDLDQTVITAQESLKTQNLNLASDEQKLNAVLDVVNSAATEQRNYWQKTSADSDKTVKALRIAVDRASLLLDHTDKNLNGALLPDVDREFGFTAQSAQMAFDSVGKTADAATFQINDLGPTMTNLGETSARLANAAAYFQSASGHADKILADGEKTADYYEKKLTTPASFAQRLGYGLLDVGSKLGNIMAGFVK